MVQELEKKPERVVSVRLKEWYLKNSGDKKFPWRTLQDPYKILVAEMLLQRTRGESVGPLYVKFISKFPTPVDILQVSIEELEIYFKKLGLKYRARRLYNIAELILKKYNGRVPCNFRELLTLPGVGVYIASAIMNFGCGKPTPVVDVNVMRVLNRMYGIERETLARAKIWQFYKSADPRIVGYSLIDLGREVCTLTPRCEKCPLKDICPRKPISSQWRMLRKIIKDDRIILKEQPVKNSKKLKY